ncbi:sodium:solute symporter family protein [Ktedonobacter racemifer]|uniref:Na+/solute symporter n=1 Tax=Ktedonobacter racemifer DSM 44963 TaxID=485913 RepID=D6U628_KTERA|nr:sodium:solute symporter family protein [Ktedonobacter racemifer]EFH80439.1 Na+/solute symporter [Ktedonobacter racemifer DSM 44963]
MSVFDWIVLALYFLLMVAIGIWSHRQVHNTSDYFTAGGKMSWWLAGISHHMSGYSAAVFVAYAAIAYTYGFTLYVWWAFAISVAVIAGAFIIAPRWSRLRQRLHIISPMQYLATRYNIPTQQLLAWSGTLLKVFDVGAKWSAIAIILNVYTSLPLAVGILISGGASLIYVTVGGLWADALTDFAQFIVQLVAGIVLFVIVLAKLGGVTALGGMWNQLPPSHHAIFGGPYTIWFVLAYLLINFLSYNGGTWNLAQRFIAVPSGSQARKAAILSAVLYLVWPIILFYPMWAAPILFPRLSDPSQAYAIMSRALLPPGLIGFVLAGMFAHTMAMTSSDANAISAVVTGDILPFLSRRLRNLSGEGTLRAARIVTFIFTVLSMIIALESNLFGGVIGLIVTWFAALVGPISIPMLFGLLPAFRRCGPAAAIISWAGGIIAFGIIKYGFTNDVAATVSLPVLVSIILYVGIGLISGRANPDTVAFVNSLNSEDGGERGAEPELVDAKQL